jgi:hypothetical protein
VRNLKLDGQQTSYNPSASYQGRAFHIRAWARSVNLESLEITGFAFAAVSGQTYVAGTGVTEPIAGLALRNSHIHRNVSMGFLGDAQGLVIEGNHFEANNMAPFRGNGPGTSDDEYVSNFNHAIYLSGHGRDGLVRNNRFTNNSVTDQTDSGTRQCVGGNVTAHGQWDGLVLEGNTITQNLSAGSCYGISMTMGGYGTPEYFRGLVVRNNTIVNLGGCAICVNVATSPVIEGNLLINLNDRWMTGIVLGTTPAGRNGSDVDNGATLRNNTYCTTYGPPGQGGNMLLNTISAGTITQTGNITRTGAEASTGPCAR